MWVVLHSKTSIQRHVNHYTLFPLHPPLQNADPLPRGPDEFFSGAEAVARTTLILAIIYPPLK